MRKILCMLLILLFALTAKADKGKFKVSDIPDPLLKNAHVVKRMENDVFVISKLNSTTLERHYAITILDPAGDKFANFAAYYDQLHKVKHIKGYLYDNDGNLVRKLKRRDIQDLSASSNESFMDDSRVKVHNFHYHNYPYTIEYAYEVQFNHTFYFPSWVPVKAKYEAVQNSTFTVKYFNGYKLRYHSENIDQKPVAKSVKKMQVLHWSIHNKPAIQFTDEFTSFSDIVPMVNIAPSRFELDGRTGDMDSWKDFGLFLYQLNKGRDELPENIQLKVQEITKDLQTPKQKIKALYTYLQNTTHYISIQLGIGGWQPFDAKYVASHGYGDCKALTNYMRSLLKEAGIKSYYTLVYAGRDAMAKSRVIANFPSNRFNHVILCVPLTTDTVWLECTSQQVPAGYLGAFTADREALMITPDGGKPVNTPKYGVNQNLQIRNIKAILSPDGTSNLNIQTSYSGLKQDFISGLTKTLSHQKVKRYLSKTIPFSSFNIEDFQFHFKDSSLPVMKSVLDIVSQNLATISGKRIFITPNILTKYTKKVRKIPGRKVDFHFDKAFSDSDHVEISLPSGYQIEANIKPVELKSDFAYYKIKVRMVNDKLVYERVFKQYRTTLPATDQDKIVAFYQKVYNTDRKKMVLVRR